MHTSHCANICNIQLLHSELLWSCLVKEIGGEFWEMTQWVKCLHTSTRTWVQDPEPIEKAGCGGICLKSQPEGGWRIKTGGPLGLHGWIVTPGHEILSHKTMWISPEVEHLRLSFGLHKDVHTCAHDWIQVCVTHTNTDKHIHSQVHKKAWIAGNFKKNAWSQAWAWCELLSWTFHFVGLWLAYLKAFGPSLYSRYGYQISITGQETDNCVQLWESAGNTKGVLSRADSLSASPTFQAVQGHKQGHHGWGWASHHPHRGAWGSRNKQAAMPMETKKLASVCCDTLKFCSHPLGNLYVGNVGGHLTEGHFDKTGIKSSASGIYHFIPSIWRAEIGHLFILIYSFLFLPLSLWKMFDSLALAIMGKRKSTQFLVKGPSKLTTLSLPFWRWWVRSGQAHVSVCSCSELTVPMSPQGIHMVEIARLGILEVSGKWENALSVFEILGWI